MRLIQTMPPEYEPVALNEVTSHLRIDPATEESVYIGLLVTAARQRLEQLLGRALIRQTWKLTIPTFAPYIRIPKPPLISIDQITYLDQDGASQTIDLDNILVSGIGDSDPAIIRPKPGFSWPPTYDYDEAIGLTFTCGYENPGASPSGEVPAPLKAAMLLDIASMYETREAISIGSGSVLQNPAYNDLISDFRIWSFG